MYTPIQRSTYNINLQPVQVYHSQSSAHDCNQIAFPQLTANTNSILCKVFAMHAQSALLSCGPTVLLSCYFVVRGTNRVY